MSRQTDFPPFSSLQFIKKTLITASTTHINDVDTRVCVFNAAGGGASGGMGATTTGRGGSAASFMLNYLITGFLGGESCVITIGVGGASVTTASTNGNNGTATSFIIAGSEHLSFSIPGGGNSINYWQAGDFYGVLRDTTLGVASSNTNGSDLAYNGLWRGANGGEYNAIFIQGGNSLHVPAGDYNGPSGVGASTVFGKGGNGSANNALPVAGNGTGYGSGGGATTSFILGVLDQSGAGAGGMIEILEYK
ncbi:MAG: hypothetical protein QM504_08440 [Pseudomonadota bacterium]